MWGVLCLQINRYYPLNEINKYAQILSSFIATFDLMYKIIEFDYRVKFGCQLAPKNALRLIMHQDGVWAS